AMDVAPSLLKLAGVETPNVAFDGEDCRDALFGNQARERARLLFWRRPPDRPPPAGGAACADLAVRDGRWKLLCTYDGTHAELYDLDNDPVDAVNVAAEHADGV